MMNKKVTHIVRRKIEKAIASGRLNAIVDYSDLEARKERKNRKDKLKRQFIQAINRHKDGDILFCGVIHTEMYTSLGIELPKEILELPQIPNGLDSDRILYVWADDSDRASQILIEWLDKYNIEPDWIFEVDENKEPIINF
jgi:hypothetical protein